MSEEVSWWVGGLTKTTTYPFPAAQVIVVVPPSCGGCGLLLLLLLFLFLVHLSRMG